MAFFKSNGSVFDLAKKSKFRAVCFPNANETDKNSLETSSVNILCGHENEYS